MTHQEQLFPASSSQQVSATAKVTSNDSSALTGDNAIPVQKGNPYAKRKQPCSETGNNNFGHSNGNQSRTSEFIGPARQNIQNHTFNIPLPNPNATFSQAFSSIEESTYYESQHLALKSSIDKSGLSSNKSSHLDERLVAEQTSFDNQQVADSNVNFTRENHMTLQTHVLHVSNKQRGNGCVCNLFSFFSCYFSD